MKRWVGRVLGVLVLVATIARAEEVEPRAGGRLELPFARTGLKPVAYASDWTRREGVGCAADGRRQSAFEIKDAGRAVLSGTAEFNESDGAIAATWRMTALREWSGKGVYLTAELPAAEYGEGTMRVWRVGEGADATRVELTTRGDDPTLYYGLVRQVSLQAKGKALTLAFAHPVRVRLQDNRKWRGKTFSLRMEVGGEKLKVGDKLELSCRVSASQPLALPRPPEAPIAQGPNWIPMPAATDVLPGSALDFSTLCGPRQPAGAFGRVIRSGGHFEFERQPGVAQRFYGVNLCGSAVNSEAKDAERLVDRLVRMGYNAVRVHHHERALTGPDGFVLDPEKMKRFRRFVDLCTAHGLYVTTDLFVSRGPITRRSIGEDRDGNVEMQEYKELVLFHEGAFSNYVAWTRQFLGHVHPATGLRLAEEPALAWLSLVNEGNLGNNGMRWFRQHPEVSARWRAWLTAKRASEPALYRNVPDELPINVSLEDDQSVHLAAFTLFMGDLERTFVARMRKLLREELNCRALVTDMNSWRYPAAYQLVRRECLDFLDEHHYYDHPEFDGSRWGLPSRCDNGNPFMKPNLGVPEIAVRRIFGQPFTASEFGYCAPSAYRSVGGLLFGALAAWQDWSGIWRFAWSHGPQGVTAPEAKTMDYFDLTGDPLALATERAAVCLFLRGDLKPAEKIMPLELDAVRLARPEVPARTSVVGRPELAWDAKIGCTLGNGQIARSSNEVFIPSSERAGRPFPKNDGTFAVATPCTCGVFAEDGKIVAGGLAVEIRESRATVWASALDGRPLGESARILVTHLTDALDAGTRFGDARHKSLLGWGGLPHLMRAGKAHVSLAVTGSGHRVYALAPDGSRRGEVSSERKQDGRLEFLADVGRNPARATWFYEVISERQ